MKALLLLPLVAACATLPAPSGPVALDRSQRIGRFVVTPVAVVEDSRCPMNARCIWAGRVVVRATVRDGNVRLSRNFVLGEPAAARSDAAIVLDSVTPERMAGAQAEPIAYRFHFSLAAPVTR